MKFEKISMKSMSDFLTDDEMKATRGGYGNDVTYADVSGTCCVKYSSRCVCGFNKSTVISIAGCKNSDGTNCDNNWCCDSCGSTQTGWPSGCWTATF